MKTVLIDFDGVLHSYTSGWQGKANIPDDPNPGAIKFLKELIADEEIEPVIWTSRVHWENNAELIEAENAVYVIKDWLAFHGLTSEEVNPLKITNNKPPAVMIIDDRAWQFVGLFPNTEAIRNFKPWKPGDRS